MIDDNINHEYIIRYLRDLLPKRDGITGRMEKYAKENDVPVSQPESIKLLEVLIRIGKIKRVLEIGSAIGYSSICMAGAGCEHIDTIEISEEMAAEAEKNIAEAQLENIIHLHKGDANELLPRMDGEYDMIFIDAAKGQYGNYLPHCMRMLKRGGVLVSDNVLYKGMTATDELVMHRKITIVRRLRKYLEELSGSERFDTSVIPIGDGIALSYKY